MENFENYGEGLVIQYGSPNSAGYIDKKRFHMHPSYEVLYIPKNVIANTIINGNMIHTDYPIIVINAPYCMHFTYYEESKNLNPPKNWVVFYVGKEFLANFSEGAIPIKELLEENNARFFDISSSYSEFDTVIDFIMKHRQKYKDTSLIQGFSFGILMNLLLEHSQQEKGKFIIGENNYLSEAVRFIHENLNQNLTVSEISKHFFVSRDKLNRDFRNYMNMSALEFITATRINTAKDFLKKGEKSIREISSLCGFENDIYFYSFFKKHTGMTPREYTEKNLHSS